MQQSIEKVITWNNPTKQDICNALDLNNITKTADWIDLISFDAKLRMIKYFQNDRFHIEPWLFFILAKHFRLGKSITQSILQLYASKINFHTVKLNEDKHNNHYGDKYTGDIEFYYMHREYWFGPLKNLSAIPPYYLQVLKDRFTQLKSQMNDAQVCFVQDLHCNNADDYTIHPHFYTELLQHLSDLRIFFLFSSISYDIKCLPFCKHPRRLTSSEINTLITEYDENIYKLIK